MTRTSRVTSSEGFTLLEILIVIALLALIATVGIPSVNNALRTSKESFATKLALLLRDARDRAMLQNKLLRLRIDLDKQQYWVEQAPSTYLRPKPPDRSTSEEEKEREKKEDTDSFQLMRELTGAKLDIPEGIKVMEVISPRSKDPIKEGIADVYFYGNGSADGVSIHLEDEDKVRQSITLNPVTGHSKLAKGYEEGKP